MSKKVAIITARGGSKRVPGKNIKPFLGFPIIKYSIEAALRSGCFDEVMVSTDDEGIAAVARSFGAKTPFLRSAVTSDDFSSTADVIEEVILEYKKAGTDFDYLCCIYPTAPFITSEKLKMAMDLLIREDADCVLPIVRYSYPIQRSLKIENGKALMLWPENYFARSQDLNPVYHDCGQFYFMKTTSLLAQMKLFAEKTIPLVTPETEVQDIDNEEDWKIAEIKYSFLSERIKNRV
jgi:pseudaminic acid cytidylyltransferase